MSIGNLLGAMTSDATALDLTFGGFTTTPKPQYESRKIDLCDYHHSNYLAILSLKWVCFQRFATETNNKYPNILIIMLELVIESVTSASARVYQQYI